MWPWKKKTKKKDTKKTLPFSPPEKEQIPGSPAEQRIHRYLKQQNIEFEQEKTFPDLVNPDTGKQLRLDFWFPKYGFAIEYQGSQHYEFHKDYHDQDPDKYLLQRQRELVRDLAKKEYAYLNKFKIYYLSKKNWHNLEETVQRIITRYEYYYSKYN